MDSMVNVGVKLLGSKMVKVQVKLVKFFESEKEATVPLTASTRLELAWHQCLPGLSGGTSSSISVVVR